jgi:hypothetical protein
MVTATADGTASPHRTAQLVVTSTEVVAVVTDNAAASTASIHRLHRARRPLPTAGAVSAASKSRR